LYRAQGRDPDGERVLREALAREPGAADVHHALGLLLVRGGRRQDALVELGRAAELAPDVPRYAYAYALGLDATGERVKALGILADAQRRLTGEGREAARHAAVRHVAPRSLGRVRPLGGEDLEEVAVVGAPLRAGDLRSVALAGRRGGGRPHRTLLLSRGRLPVEAVVLPGVLR